MKKDVKKNEGKISPVLDPVMRVQFLPGVGPKRAEQLARLGVERVADLFYLLPRRYLDATCRRPVSGLTAPEREVTVVGTMSRTRVMYSYRRKIGFEAVLDDGTGKILCRWFGRAFLQGKVEKGQRWLVFGEVKLYQGKLFLSPVEYARVDEEGPAGGGGTLAGCEGGVIPVYPLTEGLTQNFMRKLTVSVLPAAGSCFEEHLSGALRKKHGILTKAGAIVAAHRPESLEAAAAARRSLAFEELFFLELMLLGRRIHLRSEKRSRVYKKPNRLVRQMGRALPFELTGAQKRVLRQIDAELSGPHPMNRLIQGDVGSGKTIVALFACLRAVENGYQAAIMAPTEVLAEQHYRSMTKLLAAVDIEPVCLLGKLSASRKQEITEALASGRAPVAVGTHALIQEHVRFRDLGLVVIDEQHRFGVNQRLALKDKGADADCLVMTATPIPRSLALTLYGDLDVSVIDEMPAGRKPVETHVVPEGKRADMQSFIAQRVSLGERAFVVCPRIEQDETGGQAAAEQWYRRYRDEIFPDLSVVMVHGRMRPEEKEQAMRAFETGRAQVLVGTTVIEVGIDVPEATVMVIEHAERFGLSQLHQLRGRVGRSHRQSWCLLMPSAGANEKGEGDEKDDEKSIKNIERLRIITSTTDGFRISEEDLRLRGPGDFFGERQSGLPELKFADIVEDYPVLVQARSSAGEMLGSDPYLEAPEHESLNRELVLRYRGRLGFLRSG
ncbi:MAG: ATP-dependent DNA helicase RecG [Gemmatimonadota bacterium]|nr:ATP-dependent DNA helicase RecG [Gemmatimonadota bacterium]